MKKIALLLAVLMLACCALASCGGDDANSSSAASSAASEASEASSAASSAVSSSATSVGDETSTVSSDDVTSEVSEESSEEPVPGVELSATEGVNREGTNLAAGCSVEGAELPTNPNATNYSGDLTDGIFSVDGSVPFDTTWFGWWLHTDESWLSASNTVNGYGVATVDLGAVKEISSVCTQIVTGCGSGIASPSKLIFECSADGSVYDKIGELSFEKPGEGTSLEGVWYGFILDDSVEARYVRVSYGVQSIWTFVSEIEVY